ncbi:MAG: glycosyltransferase [Eubacteriales bacterium]
MSIDVSVIVPVYNTEKYLRECIESIIAQTFFDCMEVILVDDGSQDNSPEICDEYSNKYKNIMVIHQENAGVSAARNMGIDTASGKYIGFVDSDDYIFSDMYEQLLESAKTENLDMSFCGFVFCYPETEMDMLYPFSKNKVLDDKTIKSDIYSFMLKSETFNSCCNKLFKRAVVEANQMNFEVGRTIGEDRLFTIQFLAKCSTVCYVPYAGYYYRLVDTSVIHAPRKDYVTNMIAQYHEDFELFESLGMEREIIQESSGLKLLEQSIVGLYFADNKLQGRDKLTVMNEITNNAEIKSNLKLRWRYLMKNKSRYERLIYLMLRLKSVLGIRIIMRAMKLRIQLMRCKST